MEHRTDAGTVRAGILGTGFYLPEEVRKNDWWPAEIVAKWRERALQRIFDPKMPRTAGVEAAIAGLRQHQDDPFYGAVERRVMGANQKSSEMELAAVKQALENANVDAKEIDAIISFTFVPDFLGTPTSSILHHALGCSRKCLTFSLEGACNSFGIQLSLADQGIRSGAMRRVLLVSSVAYSRMCPPELSLGAWMGDGAAAMVLGPATNGRGVLSTRTYTEGEGHKAMVLGVKGKRWYDEGRITGYSEDPEMTQRIIAGAVDGCRDVVTGALEDAGMKPSDVDFYAGHQGGPWLRPVTQEFTGMSRARTLDTFKAFGNLGAVNIPLILGLASREGVLRDDDVVATFGAGTGQTYTSVVLKWGRG